jgi:N-acetyl-anhydromuramyl-L-alanine amidase AmpD
VSSAYPEARWLPAHPSNYHRCEPHRQTFDRIVIHCTDGHPSAEGTAEMWQQPGHKSTAHFVVGQDGAVIQAVDLGDIAWHAHAANSRSVGVEHSARTPREWGSTDPGLPPSDALYAASARLVAWLCAVASLPVDRVHILGHAEADPQTTHTGCPDGCGWDWDRYMDLVAQARAIVAEGIPGA